MTTYSTSVAVRMSATKVSGSPARKRLRSCCEERLGLLPAVQAAGDQEPRGAALEVVQQAARAPRHLQLDQAPLLERLQPRDPGDRPVAQHRLHRHATSTPWRRAWSASSVLTRSASAAASGASSDDVGRMCSPAPCVRGQGLRGRERVQPGRGTAQLVEQLLRRPRRARGRARGCRHRLTGPGGRAPPRCHAAAVGSCAADPSLHDGVADAGAAAPRSPTTRSRMRASVGAAVAAPVPGSRAAGRRGDRARGTGPGVRRNRATASRRLAALLPAVARPAVLPTALPSGATDVAGGPVEGSRRPGTPGTVLARRRAAGGPAQLAVERGRRPLADGRLGSGRARGRRAPSVARARRRRHGVRSRAPLTTTARQLHGADGVGVQGVEHRGVQAPAGIAGEQPPRRPRGTASAAHATRATWSAWFIAGRGAAAPGGAAPGRASGR